MIGSWHAKVLTEIDGGELACVIDTERSRADSLATQYSTKAFYSLADALVAADFDAVAVCVPSGKHADIAVQAIRAGKHVVVEKPVEVTLEATDRIIAAQREAASKVTVISQHRFDESSRIVMDAVKSGHLGKITSGIATASWWRGQSYYDSGEWRGTWALDGGGALMNQSIHTLDLLIAFMGRPVEAFAYTDCLAHERIEVEDTVAATVRFDSGALGVVHATTAAFPGVASRIQVHGDKGSAIIENDRLIYIHTSSGERGESFFGSRGQDANQVSQYEQEGEDGPVAGSDPRMLSNAHHRQYENFFNALSGREEILVGPEEGRLAVAVILAIYESARTGKPVAIPSDSQGASRATLS